MSAIDATTNGWTLDYSAPTLTLTANTGVTFGVGDEMMIAYTTTIDDNATDVGVVPAVDL